MDKLWKQITPSDYAWEREALEFIKQALPDHEPYRAWSNFEFIAQDGSINEIDLMVLTPKGLFLVEIKSHPGTITGDSGSWIWQTPDGKSKALDNPRILTDRKAKKLASLLKNQPSARKSKDGIPFLGSLVFLSAENVVNKLEGPAKINVFTRKNIIAELTQTDETWRHRTLDKPISNMVSRAMEEAGIKESVRLRRVGQYELQELLDESDNFQEWLATHTELKIQRKVRIYLTYGKPEEEAKRLQKAASLEFQLLEGIEHPGILKAREYQQHDHGPALVYDYDPEAARLDHLLLQLGTNHRIDTYDALKALQLIAETVKYAHEQKLYHRALSPQSIYIKQLNDGQYKIKIGSWSTAERIFESESQHISAVSHLSCLVQEEASPYIALESYGGGDADPVQLDIFSLGTIAFHLFTGRKPAESPLQLQDRLARGRGLLITDEINGASDELQYLVQCATHPDVHSRIASMDEFIECLYMIEEELTRPESRRSLNPTEAREGDTFEGGITVKRPLGKGASSVVFLVDHQGQERVLKIAINTEHNKRLRDEGETLRKLRHQSIIGHHQTLDIAGHTGLLIDYANEGTLARRLREEGAIRLELLERFGEDLLSAICELEEKGILHRDIKPENIGLTMRGQLHLVLFDFSLCSVSPDNFTAGTTAYMDPFIRDLGRRRWDDFAERFSTALTLYEMATGALPSWASHEGLPAVLDGELQIDRAVFDPMIRESMHSFFSKALARQVKIRFSNAEEMLRAWRQIFLLAGKNASLSTTGHPVDYCPLSEAQLDTQIGLLELSPNALDTLSRLNINKVSELIKLPRNELVRMTGIGVKTRKELSEVIAQLQTRLADAITATRQATNAAGLDSVDRVFGSILPKPQKLNDPQRYQFLSEYLGRLDADAPKGINTIHWPTPVMLCAQIGMELSEARSLQEKILLTWSKNKAVTELRNEIEGLLAENGGVMTAVELAELILLRRGSVQESPLRERWAQAIARAAIDTELSKQEPRWILRRTGNTLLIAENNKSQGEELADYAEALGQLAEECAKQQPLLSPVRALERIRAVNAPESFAGLSNHRLLRLAAAASQSAALSSRAEFYPRNMKAAQTLELAQGALLGTKALTVHEVQSRIHGRYPEAELLPGRPQLDSLIHNLELGLSWDSTYVLPNGQHGAYCLQTAKQTTFATRTRTQYGLSQLGSTETSSLQEIVTLEREIKLAIDSSRFLALTVRPRQFLQAQAKLAHTYPLTTISFDELLLRHIRQLCDGMANPPKWEVVLQADASERNSRDWQNLMRLLHRVLPAMADEIQQAQQAVLLTDPGLIARYDLVNTWLSNLRQRLLDDGHPRGLILLIAADAQHTAAFIDGVMVPSGAGNREFARIPSVWLESDKMSPISQYA